MRQQIPVPTAPTMYRPGDKPNSEHFAEYPDVFDPLVLLLLHDFPDPGKFHRFPCSSPPSDTFSNYCLYGHCSSTQERATPVLATAWNEREHHVAAIFCGYAAGGFCGMAPVRTLGDGIGHWRLSSVTGEPVQRPSLAERPGFPCPMREWYSRWMSGTYQVVMGDRGRLVIPADLRERAGLAEGTALILLETPTGLVLLTRSQLQELVRADLAGLDLVGELLAERRAEAAADDAA